MEIKLRDYQISAIQNTVEQLNSGKKVCCVAPCGAGKTVIAAQIIKDTVDKGGRVVFITHHRELIRQAANVFDKFNIPYGFVISDKNFKEDFTAPVQIASVRTLVNRLSLIDEPDLLICDECHHILAKSYMETINYWKNAKLLGFTATPERYGGKRLGDVFDVLIDKIQTKNLIEQGYLADFRYFSLSRNLNLDKVKIVANDYDKSAISKIMNQNTIAGDIIDNYLLRANGKQTVCYCVNVEHSQELVKRFNAAGISAAHIDCKIGTAQRDAIIDAFMNKDFQVLCNVGLIGEGFDAPNMEAVILARPTRSLTLFIQQSTRGLRIDPSNPEKVTIVLDHAQNFEYFGLPDEPHQWSLEPDAEEKPRSTSNKNKKCPQCGCIVPYGIQFCPECDYAFPVRKPPAETQLTLLEIKRTPDAISAQLQNLLSISQANGYKKSWLVFQGFNICESLEDFSLLRQFLGYGKKWADCQFNLKQILRTEYFKSGSLFLMQVAARKSNINYPDFSEKLTISLFKYWQHHPPLRSFQY